MTRPTIALTGATGFIGRYLLGELALRGYQVRVLLRSPAALPAGCQNAVIGDLARPINMSAALAGVDTVIHSAGIAPSMTGAPAEDFRGLDAKATGALAHAAQRAGVRRFIFMSSLRAAADASAREILTENSIPNPTDAYGRSKLAAERELAKLDLDWVALRLALTVGPGVKGNMARLIRLARSFYPLPFGALRAKRSLLSIANLSAAVECVIEAVGPLRRPLIAADPDPLTVPEMVTAMRLGLGRRPGLVSVPESVLRVGFQMSGNTDFYRRLAEPLVADPAELLRMGWAPRMTSAQSLAAVATNWEAS
jgi:nucleoside-diphosphate-sugar epimerase